MVQKNNSKYVNIRTKLAMDRNVAFWQRKMSDQILVTFTTNRETFLYGGEELLHGGKKDNIFCQGGSLIDVPIKDYNINEDRISKDNPSLFDNIPGLLENYESRIDSLELINDHKIDDDYMRIPLLYPEIQFGCGIPGAMFGGKLIVVSSKNLTYTYNEPVITDWRQVSKLKFDEDNIWVKKIINCLRYFVDNAEKTFAIQLFTFWEGGDFIASMRGQTQALYDLVDESKELRDLLEFGYKSQAEFFEMKRDIVKEHNEKVFNHKDFSNISPIHSVPVMDTDIDVLCSPKIFENIGFKFKQKVLDHYKGGKLWIHGFGYNLIPIAGQLNNLTVLALCDDPGIPGAFDKREETRRQTFDIPIELFCRLEEFIKALDEKTLPGGIKYNIILGDVKLKIEELNLLMKRIRKYRVSKLAGRPK